MAASMWIVIGLGALGFLIGNLVGLTAHSVVTAVLSLVFAFAGGSVIALLGKVATHDRTLAGQAICALSLTCVIGVYAGIATSEWHILSPKDLRTIASPSASSKQGSAAMPASIVNKYLDSGYASTINSIDLLYRQKVITASEAYDKLYEAVRTNHAPDEPLTP
jgi:hypothetical protein